MLQARCFGISVALLLLVALSFASSDATRTTQEASSAQIEPLAFDDDDAFVKRTNNWANKIRFGKRSGDDDEAQQRWASRLRFGKRTIADQDADFDSLQFENKRGSWASKVRFG